MGVIIGLSPSEEITCGSGLLQIYIWLSSCGARTPSPTRSYKILIIQLTTLEYFALQLLQLVCNWNYWHSILPFFRIPRAQRNCGRKQSGDLPMSSYMIDLPPRNQIYLSKTPISSINQSLLSSHNNQLCSITRNTRPSLSTSRINSDKQKNLKFQVHH